MLPLSTLSVLLSFPTSFVRNVRSSSCTDGSWNFIFWNSVLGVAACTSFLVLVEYKASSWSPCFLSFHLRTFNFWILSGLHKFPCARQITLSVIADLQIDWISQVKWRIFPRAARAVQNQVDWSRLRWNRWSWLCHWWTFTGSRILTSLWHGALRSDRIRKKMAKMAAREHREIHDVEQTEKMIQFVTRKTLFG